MKRPESSFKNMVLSLGGITIIAALLLAFVNKITEEPIKASELKAQTEAMNKVLPKHDNDPLSEKFTVDGSNGEITVYPATLNGENTGAAVEAQADGFADKITVIYGFDNEGTVIDYSVLKQTETPGLGSKMQDWFRDSRGNRSIIGHNPDNENMTVSKDGGCIDGITAATISSRAFLSTLNEAFSAYKEYTTRKNSDKNE